MMFNPYNNEDMECATAARANMMMASGVGPNRGSLGSDFYGGISSTSESEVDNFSHFSVSTSRLVGTFYNPSAASDSNSMISSLQDEFDNNAPEHSYRKNVPDHQFSFSRRDNAEPSPAEALGVSASPRRRLFWLLALCLVIGIAVSMGVVIGFSKPVAPDSGIPPASVTEESHGEISAAPSFSTENASPTPTPTPSLESASPTADATIPSRPDSTTLSINTFVRNLPHYTQQALDKPNSPQKRALNWITQDPALLSYSPEQLLQRFALKTFYFSTRGDDGDMGTVWLNSEGWNSSEGYLHECQWFTTYQDDTIEPACDDLAVYTVLSLRRNNVRGSLPPELALLTALKVVDLESNNIQSVIPTEIGLLTHLERFHLGANGLSGSIPTEMGQLSALVSLAMENNAMSDAIPTHLGMLRQLVNLTLDDNQFEGKIPPELGQLTALQNVLLHGNYLNESIPTQVGQCRWLQSLSLRHNFLSGDMPTELGLLTNLERLWAYQNELGGSLPTQLGLATRLTQLSLSRNQLKGQLPTELGRLTVLKNLWLYQNQFTGSLPTELGLLTELELLPVRGNQIGGAVPDEVCSIEKLEVTVDCWRVACNCSCTCANKEETDDVV